MYLPQLKDLETAFASLQMSEDVKAFLLFAAEDDLPSTIELEQVLASNHKPLLGGIFPEIIADGERHATGFVLLPMYTELQVGLFEEKTNATQWDDAIMGWSDSFVAKPQAVFCFVNSLWKSKVKFMNHLYNAFGPFVNYLGAGAGSLKFRSFPCIFANQQVVENAAVLAVMPKPITTGVAHGWHPLSDLIKVTETRGNSIVSLNWRPAFDEYHDQISAHAQVSITEENFFEVAKSYPLGLVKLDDEMLIRDPYGTQEGLLHVLDEVPQGEYIRIMHGDLSSLLTGANSAVSKLNLAHEQERFCVNCISRVLFMQADFEKELAILNQHQPINGVLSLGEITNPNGATLSLYNKTVVAAQWIKTN